MLKIPDIPDNVLGLVAVLCIAGLIFTAIVGYDLMQVYNPDRPCVEVRK